MTSPSEFSPTLRASLARMADVSDRTPPAVFVGREDEIALLDAAVRGVRRGDVATPWSCRVCLAPGRGLCCTSTALGLWHRTPAAALWSYFRELRADDGQDNAVAMALRAAL